MLKIKIDCTACGACEQICSQNCIVLKRNSQEMLFPEIDESKCVNCNLCEKVCHLNNQTMNVYSVQRAYAVSHPSTEILNRSTSGGAFTAIAKYVLFLHIYYTTHPQKNQQKSIYFIKNRNILPLTSIYFRFILSLQRKQNNHTSGHIHYATELPITTLQK